MIWGIRSSDRQIRRSISLAANWTVTRDMGEARMEGDRVNPRGGTNVGTMNQDLLNKSISIFLAVEEVILMNTYDSVLDPATQE